MTLPKRILSVVAFLLLLTLKPAWSQSASNWVPVKAQIGPVVVDPSTQPPVLNGESYLTMQVSAVRIYQRSRWWQNLIESNRQAVATITVSGVVPTATGSANFEDTRISEPIALVRSRESYTDIPFSPLVVKSLPATFSQLSVRLQISKTAKNGLADLLTVASSISKTTPALALSPETAAAVTASQVVADKLFSGGLLQKKVESVNDIDTGGTGFSSGYYVILAGATAAEYSQILLNADKLLWTGAQLTYNGVPIDNLSYFVIRVRSDAQRFSDKVYHALGQRTPWARLYREGRGKLAGFNQLSEADDVQKGYEALYTDAFTLLQDDISLTSREQHEIHNAIAADTKAQFDTLKAGMSPAG